MLEIYWDESGSHDSDHLIVAGYIAPSENWSQFTWEWKQILDEFRLPYFRMQEFRNGRSKLFSHLRRTAKQRVIEQLIKTIRTHVSLGIISSVNVKEFNSLVPHKVRGIWGAAYTVCIHACLDEIKNWTNQSEYSGPISFTFDSGHKNLDQALQLLLWIKSHKRMEEMYMLGAIGAGSDQSVIPLQAADILAHESFRSKIWQPDYKSHLTDHFRSLAKRPAPPTHTRMNSDRESIGEFLSLVGGITIRKGRLVFGK